MRRWVLHCGLWLALATAQPCLAGEEPLSAAQSLARLVNRHALPGHLITGQRDGARCVLRLQSDAALGAGTQEGWARARILRELLSSGVGLDVRRFNAPRSSADEAVFLVDEQTCAPLEYRPQLQQFRAPRAPRQAGLAVGYATGQAPQAHMVVEVVSGGRASTLQVRPNPAAMGAAPRLDLGRPVRELLSDQGNDVVVSLDGTPLFDWSLGRWPLLRNFRFPPGMAVRVRNERGGNAVAGVSQSVARGARLAFPEGAVLTVLAPDSRGIPVVKAQLSWRQYHRTNMFYERDAVGREHWSHSPSNFELQVVRSLNGLPNNGTARRNVILSLRPQLNAALQRLLDQAVQQQDRQVGADVAYGSLVLMNGLTGEYLGAAGYPQAPPPRRLPNQELVEDGSFREEFLRRRVIGSVAKAPISFAIIATTPLLSALEVPEYEAGDQKSILGLKLEKPFTDHNPHICGTLITFECYLAQSLNRYAVNLLALAAVPGLGADHSPLARQAAVVGKLLGNDRVALSHGQEKTWLEHQPTTWLWAQEGSDDRKPSGEQLLGLPWVQYARSEYGVDVALSAQTGLSESDVYDQVWLQALGKPGNASFQIISPEKENLRLNQVSDFRSDYVPLILGGGNSMWSSARVAEVFARTVTGYKVQGSFVKLNSREDAQPLKNMSVDAVSDARQRFLKGLEMVFVNGTGKLDFGRAVARLQQRAEAKGLELKIYAKSGTPDVTVWKNAGGAEYEIMHPVEAAYARGLINAKYSDGKRFFYYKDQLIDTAFLRTVKFDQNRRVQGSDLTLGDLRFLARLNDLDGGVQSLLCSFNGAALDCRWPSSANDGRVRTWGQVGKTNEGRNYAVFAALQRKGDKNYCHAVSMAVSFSRSGVPFTKMMNELLDSDKGPLSSALGLNGQSVEPNCEAAP